MASDENGHAPKWLKWVIGGALIVGAVALTIGTAGVGTALATSLGGGFLGTVASGAIVGATFGAVGGVLVNAGTQIIANGFENFSYSELGKSAISGAIAGAIAGGIFSGIQFGLSANKIASGASGIKNAQSNLNNSFNSLRDISKLSGTPFANSNVMNSLGRAASNYNNAYSSFALAKATYNVVNAAANATYLILETVVSEFIELLF